MRNDWMVGMTPCFLLTEGNVRVPWVRHAAARLSDALDITRIWNFGWIRFYFGHLTGLRYVFCSDAEVVTV